MVNTFEVINDVLNFHFVQFDEVFHHLFLHFWDAAHAQLLDKNSCDAAIHEESEQCNTRGMEQDNVLNHRVNLVVKLNDQSEWQAYSSSQTSETQDREFFRTQSIADLWYEPGKREH